jgi:trk system potassium uptake protein TrkA
MPHMKYIVVGCGRVGSGLAKLLAAESHDVAVIDENPAAFKRLGNAFSGRVEVGTGIDYDVLQRAGADGADGFVAVTDGDNRNIMAALIAQRMFGIKRIVARIYDPPRGQLYRELGIETFCPTTIGAKIIRDRLFNMPYEAIQTFDYGKLSLLSVTLGKPTAGMKISEVDQDGRIRISAIQREGRTRVAAPNDVLEAGDTISAVVAPDALPDFARMFSAGGELTEAL